MSKYLGTSISYTVARPTAALEQEVEFYHQAESGGVVEHPRLFLDLQIIVLPLNCVEMIFNYHDTSVRLRHGNDSNRSKGKIVGQHNLQTTCRADNITRINKTFHIRFKPGAYHTLLGMPQGEVKNSCFAIGDVLGKEGKILEDDINNSDSFETRIGIIETFLLRRKKLCGPLRGNGHAASAVTLIQSCHGTISVRDVGEYLGISGRTLERSFSCSIGLSPKEFIRLARFSRVLATVVSERRFVWAEHPNLYDYYDEAHFIKEFKAATTFSPGYFRDQLGKRIAKGVNFLVTVETITPHLGNLLNDFAELERQNAGFSRPSG